MSADESLACNAGKDVIFQDEITPGHPARACGAPGGRVTVFEFPTDPGIIEVYCPAHLVELRRRGYRVVP